MRRILLLRLDIPEEIATQTVILALNQLMAAHSVKKGNYEIKPLDNLVIKGDN